MEAEPAKPAAKPPAKAKAAAKPRAKPKPAAKSTVKAKAIAKPKPEATPSPPRLKTFVKLAEWDALGYRMGPAIKTKDFDFRFNFVLNAAQKAPRGRAAFNVLSKGDHYFVEFATHGIHLGRAEGGIEQRLGASFVSALKPGQTHELAIKRRDDRIMAVLDGRIAAQARDYTLQGGHVALGVAGKAAKIFKVKVQPVAGLYFSDDFMRASQDTSAWSRRSGKWEIHALENPTRSINAFSYIGQATKAPAVAMAGYWFWTDYEYAVSFKSTGAGSVGVLFGCRDANNGFRLRWGASNAAKAQRKLLVERLAQGKASVLASSPGGFRPNQWYRLRFVMLGPHLSVEIDGQRVFNIKDLGLSGGLIGLYTDTKGPTYFDDVLVQRARGFMDSFDSDSPGTWTAYGGQWRVQKAGVKGFAAKGDGAMAVKAGPGSRLIAGKSDWSRLSFSADVAPLAKGAAGLVFAYLDEASYGLFRIKAGAPPAAELVHVRNGKELVLSKRPLPGHALNARTTLAIDSEDGVVAAYVAGVKVAEAYAKGFLRGRVGLYADRTDTAFDNVHVQFHEQNRTPVFTVNKTFADEKTMANWAAAQSDWRVAEDAAKKTKVSWHRGDFPGDVMLRMSFPPGAATTGTVTLCLAASEEKEATGYQLAATPGKAWKLALKRQGKTVAEGAADIARPRDLDFRRLGSHLLAYLDGHVALAWRDPKPLAGDRLAWQADNAALANEHVSVFSDHVLTDSFTAAPVSWRIGAGTWAVTNRWQCDPRWSFFAGWRDDGPAVLWHKREFHGDITLEFAAGIKMDYTKTVGYQFASDLNAVICADGRDVASGYSFVFGGWGNKKTAIVRQGQVVAEASKPLIDGYIHRRWWYFKIEKRGPKLRYWVDNALVLEYTDPKPLAGNRIAIWTYKHGLVLSRFRISCPGPMPAEPYNFNPPAECRSFYDLPAQAAKK